MNYTTITTTTPAQTTSPTPAAKHRLTAYEYTREYLEKRRRTRTEVTSHASRGGHRLPHLNGRRHPLSADDRAADQERGEASRFRRYVSAPATYCEFLSPLSPPPGGGRVGGGGVKSRVELTPAAVVTGGRAKSRTEVMPAVIGAKVGGGGGGGGVTRSKAADHLAPCKVVVGCVSPPMPRNYVAYDNALATPPQLIDVGVWRHRAANAQYQFLDTGRGSGGVVRGGARRVGTRVEAVVQPARYSVMSHPARGDKHVHYACQTRSFIETR